MKTSIIVQNLKCGGCAKTITSKISELDYISNVQVNTETATVSFTTQGTEDALSVKEKLKSLGYPSIEDENGMLSKAKSFVSCATGKMK
ncbi:heavy metal transporter [Dokdonia sp. Dokd-P16]|uniref:heavy-metal-associated domain-containing protein n=1 Tax=Dokdonia sp. Dokd-P16 TaxID=2173169 RepID=UPI000D5477D7|nr:heavy metal-associated domain-containing protein [Dokdonia sp. Dokd-P16]AWH73214.1 heavy metal transporter [Dokdonia sp. Dokd-P16]